MVKVKLNGLRWSGPARRSGHVELSLLLYSSWMLDRPLPPTRLSAAVAVIVGLLLLVAGTVCRCQ